MVRHQNYPMPIVSLPVRSSETGPSIDARFILDTGATVSILRNPLLIERLRLEGRPPLTVQKLEYAEGRLHIVPVHEVGVSLNGNWLRVPFAIQPVSGLSWSLLGHYDFLDRFQATFYRTRDKGPVEANLSL